MKTATSQLDSLAVPALMIHIDLRRTALFMARSILREVWDVGRFVSATQAFNTASFIEPLTLKVLLLSFALSAAPAR
jgi:hypothetical protein